ncbi:MAG TPA: hypothetical protein VMU92_02860 [Acidobacteriaceae bacterium]|nr:hypothetical protein [Acidobacteriaceae bacterium]
MTKVFVDGVEIDSEIWIDGRIATFKNQKESRTVRLAALKKEIDAYESSLTNFGLGGRDDAPAEAHTKAYIAALKQAAQEIGNEMAKDRDQILENNSSK